MAADGDTPGSMSETHRTTTDHRALAVALGLILALMATEVTVAVVAGSLALLADAGHMLADAGALAGSMWALRLARRPASPVWSFGLKRAEILAAAANGVTLLVVGALVGVEAIRRLVHPLHVHGVPMLTVALVGVVVNIVVTSVLRRTDQQSLNMRGAFLHILTDMYAFAGTAVAAVIIITTSWERADAVASLLVVALVLRASWALIGPSGHILLEGTPRSVDLTDVRAHIEELPEVMSVHDLHAWALTTQLPALSAHIVVAAEALNDGGAGRILDHLQHCLANHFDVEHSTFQLEAETHAEHEPGMHA